MNDNEKSALTAVLRSIGIVSFDVHPLAEYDDSVHRGLLKQPEHSYEVDFQFTRESLTAADAQPSDSTKANSAAMAALAEQLQEAGFRIGLDQEAASIALYSQGGSTPILRHFAQKTARIDEDRARIIITSRLEPEGDHWGVLGDTQRLIAIAPSDGKPFIVVPRLLENHPDSPTSVEELQELMHRPNDNWLNRHIRTQFSSTMFLDDETNQRLANISMMSAIARFFRYVVPDKYEGELLAEGETPASFRVLDWKLRELVEADPATLHAMIRGTSDLLVESLLTILNRSSDTTLTSQEWLFVCQDRERLEVLRDASFRGTGTEPFHGLSREVDRLGEELLYQTDAELMSEVSEELHRARQGLEDGWWLASDWNGESERPD